MASIKRSEFISAALAGNFVPDTDSKDKANATNKFANTATPQFNEKSLSGLNPYTGTFSQAQLMHLLRRTMFGVTLADLNYFNGMTLAQVVAELVTPAPTPAPPVNAYNNVNFTDPDVPAGQTWVNAAYGSGTADGYRRYSLKAWWVGLMLNQNRSVTEKMTMFWMNHFSTQMATVTDARYSYKTLAMMRANALGNFKTLAREVITDPGMLVYLNGSTNTLNNPNENFGREFQELMTVGKGPNSLYTQNDVITLAHVFTGWKDVPSTISSKFVSGNHDTSNKQFSAFYNNTVIIGQSGAAGANETDEAVNMVFSQIETAKFLCRNLYRWFLYYVIDDNIETNIITPLANLLVQNNFNVAPVLSTLFQSEHFFDPMNVGCQIKNPADHIIGLCRQFNMVFPDASNITNQYNAWINIVALLNTLAMDPGDPPNVAGWPAYYQEPEYHELWLNSDTMPLRMEYAAVLGSQNGWTNSGVTLVIDFLSFTAQLSNPSDPNQLIADAAALLSPNPLGADETSVMLNALLNGLSNPSYWTSAWNQYIAAPTNQTYINTVVSRLRPMYNYLLGLAEYQLI
jgi:uncharacterized protein (DUF1800 family)